jgi:predicted negative regulator of RcsB-dependent stress response
VIVRIITYELAKVNQVGGIRRRMLRRWQTLWLMAASSCVLMTACVNWQGAEVSSTQRDKLLFERAMSAVEQDRFTVANLTLQTLINTYPDSEYASKAKQVLEDPRIAPCGESWTSSRQCIDRRAHNDAQGPAISQ